MCVLAGGHEDGELETGALALAGHGLEISSRRGDAHLLFARLPVLPCGAWAPAARLLGALASG